MNNREDLMKMDEDLPTEYDVIVVGTGMTESIVAAAASRIGKKVLHLDSNEYYGGLWASFNFDGLQKWMKECREPTTHIEKIVSLNQGEKMELSGNQFSTITNLEEMWYILEDIQESPEGQLSSKNTQTETQERDMAKCGEGSDADSSQHGALQKVVSEDFENPHPTEGKDDALNQRDNWSQNKLKREYRKFNLDLAPKLLFARGSLVELLISSNIARYAEFRSVTRVLTWVNGCLEPVPCSRADVFSTQNVSVSEKRMLMKLLSSCVENEDTNKEFEGFEDKTFVEYLKSKKLTTNLIHYVLYAIAMATEKTKCADGVNQTQRFLNSLGRYGNTPFLWPMYGSGEIPQCFCRLCAVFGGLYHLKRTADAIIISANENKCIGILSGQQRLETSNLVMGVGYAPSQFLKTAPSGGLSRGIFITDRSILPTDKESLTLLQFPPLDGVKEPVTVIEVGHTTNACPKGLYVVHMTCKQQSSAREDLQAVVNNLLHVEFNDGTLCRIDTDNQSTQTHPSQEVGNADSAEGVSAEGSELKPSTLKPQVLWSLYFNCPETSECDLSSNTPSNIFLCSGPDLDLDFEFAVKQAKEIFTKMYPASDFLPRAPDPEEIVLDGEGSSADPDKDGEEMTDPTPPVDGVPSEE